MGDVSDLLQMAVTSKLQINFQGDYFLIDYTVAEMYHGIYASRAPV